MSSSVEALKQAVILEKQALEQYQIASENSLHSETKQELEKYLSDKQQKIDALSWMIMAESGTLEKSDEAPKENGAQKLAAGKCPFSGELAKMGIDITKMSKPDL